MIVTAGDVKTVAQLQELWLLPIGESSRFVGGENKERGQLSSSLPKLPFV